MNQTTMRECSRCDGTGSIPCGAPWCADLDHDGVCSWCAGQGERPFVRIQVSEVPWVSGTVADLECWRRKQRDLDGFDSHFPSCCRWPKSCSAFDPGFTRGKGPTVLPEIYNDGYGWRSRPRV